MEFQWRQELLQGEMEIKIERRWFTEKTTIGELYIDGVFECFTLEDRSRFPVKPSEMSDAEYLDLVERLKVQNVTAVPPLRYALYIGFSEHFQRMMIHIQSVPGYCGCEIHSGNRDTDTDGCVLVGKKRSVDLITESLFAYGAFFAKVNGAIRRKEQAWLTIENNVAVDSQLQPPEMAAGVSA